jgi:carbamate kinase
MRVVVALGGNALSARGEAISAPNQRANAARAAEALAPLIAEHEVIVTHGNGPQVGLLLNETEQDGSIPPYPLDILGAESEGMVGYIIEQALARQLPGTPFATLLTQTVIDANDPAMAHPTKPVGPLLDEGTAQRLAAERGLAVAPDTGGWRRVVPSPAPVRPFELAAIAHLVDGGFTVIASGGGGVPVTVDERGRPTGVEAVIDKDLAAAVLARALGATVLLLLTDVDGVYRGFGSPTAERIERLDPPAASALLATGELPPGSMGAKLKAAVAFAEAGGTTVIAALADARAALDGTAGTTIAT